MNGQQTKTEVSKGDLRAGDLQIHKDFSWQVTPRVISTMLIQSKPESQL